MRKLIQKGNVSNLKKLFNHKIMFFILAIFLLLLVFLFLNGFMLQNSSIHPVQLEGVRLEIKEGTLTRSGATVVITDLGDKKSTFGESYLIEKKVFNHWKVLKCKNEWWMLQGYHASSYTNNQLTMYIDWSDNYGKLNRGEYRLLKNMAGGKYIAVEFTIR